MKPPGPSEAKCGPAEVFCLFSSNPIHFLCIYWPAVMITSPLTGIEEAEKTNAAAFILFFITPYPFFTIIVLTSPA